MPIDGEWMPRWVTERRCDRKRAMFKNKATRKAVEATAKSGTLIIAYKCPECTGWHLAHASHEELIAREREVELEKAKKFAQEHYFEVKRLQDDRLIGEEQ